MAAEFSMSYHITDKAQLTVLTFIDALYNNVDLNFILKLETIHDIIQHWKIYLYTKKLNLIRFGIQGTDGGKILPLDFLLLVTHDAEFWDICHQGTTYSNKSHTSVCCYVCVGV